MPSQIAQDDSETAETVTMDANGIKNEIEQWIAYLMCLDGVENTKTYLAEQIRLMAAMTDAVN